MRTKSPAACATRLPTNKFFPVSAVLLPVLRGRDLLPARFQAALERGTQRRQVPILSFFTRAVFRQPESSSDTRKPVMKQYKVVIYQESALSSMLLNAAKVDPVRFTEFLNRNAQQGWRVVTMEKDRRRLFLFWEREAYVVILEKEYA